MNTKKFTNFFGNSKTNWGYILILVILSFFVIGAVLTYQWRILKYEVELPEIQTILTISKEHPKIILSSDKIEYERWKDEIAEFTLFNNSSSNIFLSSINQYGGIADIYTELQKYNYEKEIWEKVYDPFFVEKDTEIPFLIKPGEKIKWNELYIDTVIEPLDPHPGKYRAVSFYYYENELCKGPSYWANEQLCEKERKKVFSNEFVIKGGSIILPEEGDNEAFEPAMNFCREKNKRFYTEKAFFLNFDEDQNKEIIGICWRRDFGYKKEGILFVLDKQNNEYKSLLEKEDAIGQRYYPFEDLIIKDIDKDGIDEIIYRERGWYLTGGNVYLHLYSPKHQEWFYRDNWWKWDETANVRKEGVRFSPNLELEKYKLFKEFIIGL